MSDNTTNTNSKALQGSTTEMVPEKLTETAETPQNSRDPNLGTSQKIDWIHTPHASPYTSSNAKSAYKCEYCGEENRPLPCGCGMLACPTCDAHCDELAVRVRSSLDLELLLLQDPVFFALSRRVSRRAMDAARLPRVTFDDGLIAVIERALLLGAL
jgi:hypothetical protein